MERTIFKHEVIIEIPVDLWAFLKRYCSFINAPVKAWLEDIVKAEIREAQEEVKKVLGVSEE